MGESRKYARQLHPILKTIQYIFSHMLKYCNWLHYCFIIIKIHVGAPHIGIIKTRRQTSLPRGGVFDVLALIVY